jgi:radical SAM superfamily enzyme YgiQ (UPF0313 family)
MPTILLIDTNTTPFNEAYPVYPIGLDYLQGALKESGFPNTHLLDLRQAGGDVSNLDQRQARSLDIIARKVKETNWDIIGISIRNIDSTYPPDPSQLHQHYYLPQIKSYVDCVREASSNKTPIILGGSGFSIMPEEILGYLGDNCYGVAGAAELILPQLIADLLDNKPRERVHRAAATRIGRLQNLVLLEKYKHLPRSMSTVGLRTQNGCGEHCSYCPYPSISGSRIIMKDVSDVLDEIHILRETGFSSFMFADDIFNASIGHAKQILAAMLNTREIPESWHAYLNPKKIDEELLELVVATNGWSYYSEQQRTVIFPFDLDSGCDRILTSIGKNFTTEDIRRTFAAFERVKGRHEKQAQVYSLSSVFHLLLGCPGEDEESIRESCQFINETLPDRLSLQIGVRVYPHTPLAQETRGVLWHESQDLLEPTFVPFSKAEIKTWLLRYLSPRYHIVSEAGNMIQLMKQ